MAAGAKRQCVLEQEVWTEVLQLRAQVRKRDSEGSDRKEALGVTLQVTQSAIRI